MTNSSGLKAPLTMDSKRLEYQSDNYEPFNRAVLAEIARQNQLTDSLRSQVELNKSLVLLRWASIAALLIISVSFALWLLKDKPAFSSGSMPLSSSILNVKKTAGAIQQNTPQSGAFIKTNFTVFETMTTDTGRQVVTGRIYTPDNLETPARQYCYLSVEMDNESPVNPGNDQDILMRTLANKQDGKVDFIAKDKALVDLSKTYCRFI